MKKGIKVNETITENQNFPIKVDDKVYWISRAMAVVGFVFKQIDDKLFVLVEKRGKGAADNIGSFCVPCGYLDFNETLEEAVLRELKEETGFVGDKNKLRFLKINSNPNENRQNVSVHFSYFANNDEDFNTDKAIGGEKDEIEFVTWLCIGTVKKLNWFKKLFKYNKKDYLILESNWNNHIWAFNHDQRIYEHISNFYDIK